MLHGRIATLRHESRVLKDNPLGDPHVREVLVYLPPDYEQGGPYPTITLLPGFAANHRSMLGYKPFQPNTAERFDAQIATGESAPAILVMPDCTNRWAGSQFLDSTATGRYQTYLAEEILPFVDEELNTLGPEGRAIAGRSSGGFGALRLAMDRPGTVAAVASHAGDAAFEVSMRPMLHHAAIAYDAAGGLEAFAAMVAEEGPKGPFAFDGLIVMACSAAYAPEPDAPAPHCALPFDPKTAVLGEGWDRWLAHDPLERPEGLKAAAGSLRTIFIDAGDRDEHGLHFAARMLFEALGDAGATVSYEEFSGGHRGTSHRYGTSLPALARALAEG
jgi:enterochelin esterase-like enzyme